VKSALISLAAEPGPPGAKDGAASAPSRIG
jgi:hypothetical protein